MTEILSPETSAIAQGVMLIIGAILTILSRGKK